MSHYTVLRTRFTDVETLVEALADVGFADVEAHDQAQPLVGYQGDTRTDLAEVIVRRKYVGRLSNDIGFARNAEGHFEAIISEFDRDRYGAAWVGRLSQRYAYRMARKVLASQDYDLVEESVDEEQKIHMTVRRMA